MLEIFPSLLFRCAMRYFSALYTLPSPPHEDFKLNKYKFTLRTIHTREREREAEKGNTKDSM